MSLTVPLAVEKVLFRLALVSSQAAVPIARAFLELPLSLEEVEQYADQVANGHSVVKNEWGEYLTYEFPELEGQQVPAEHLDDCPACLDPLPPAPTMGGVEVRRPVICGRCFDALRRLNAREPDQGVVDKLKGFFRGEEEEDPIQVMRTEHEIFFLALRLGLPQITHTTLATQSRLPSTQLKERLDRMAARKYIRVGLMPSGDAVGYTFPAGLDYPRVHFDRVSDRRPSGRVEFSVEGVAKEEPEPPPATPPAPPPSISVKTRSGPQKKLNIRIKGRRTRGT